LIVGKNVDIPECVANFCIFPYTNLNGEYFRAEYCGMEPKVEAVSPSAPSVCTSTSVFVGLRTIFVADQAPFTIWFEPVVLFTIVRELDLEWFVVRISHYHHASSCL
jgi:hypothetical protein